VGHVAHMRFPTESIKAGVAILYYEIHKLISYIWNIEWLPQLWKNSIIAVINKNAIKLFEKIIKEKYPKL
jgi:hypothetical protein